MFFFFFFFYEPSSSDLFASAILLATCRSRPMECFQMISTAARSVLAAALHCPKRKPGSILDSKNEHVHAQNSSRPRSNHPSRKLGPPCTSTYYDSITVFDRASMLRLMGSKARRSAGGPWLQQLIVLRVFHAQNLWSRLWRWDRLGNCSRWAGLLLHRRHCLLALCLCLVLYYDNLRIARRNSAAATCQSCSQC